MHLFLQSIPPTNFAFNIEEISYRVLYTNLLGEQVGTAWDLSKVMLWTPALPGNKKWEEKQRHSNNLTPSRSGLYKIQGVTVEAIMGGIFHQFVRHHHLCADLLY